MISLYGYDEQVSCQQRRRVWWQFFESRLYLAFYLPPNWNFKFETNGKDFLYVLGLSLISIGWQAAAGLWGKEISPHFRQAVSSSSAEAKF